MDAWIFRLLILRRLPADALEGVQGYEDLVDLLAGAAAEQAHVVPAGDARGGEMGGKLVEPVAVVVLCVHWFSIAP